MAEKFPRGLRLPGREQQRDQGPAGESLTQRSCDNSGAVSWTVLTSADGSYRFDDLPPGTYAISETAATSIPRRPRRSGSPRLGSVANDRFHGIELAADTHATDYNFGELGLRAELIGKHLFLASTPTAEQLVAR